MSSPSALSSTRTGPRKRERRQTQRQASTLSPLDHALLLALARHRLLSFGQMRRLLFADRSPQRVGQRLQRLASRGWLRVWEDTSQLGGRPRYALPTRRTLGLALDRLRADSIGGACERLATGMLPRSPRRPLLFAPRITPPFLAHQRECNDLLIAYAGLHEMRVLWATSWERPFPAVTDGIALPQPDYVLVLERDASPVLVFGEHDRGNESLAHFRRAKAERYAALAARPELCARAFGFPRFVVWVTVLDARTGAPLRRLAQLVAVARTAAASDVMAFTLAGWAVAAPQAPIWFCDGTLPETQELQRAKGSIALRALPTHAVEAVDRVRTPDPARTPCVTNDPSLEAGTTGVVH